MSGKQLTLTMVSNHVVRRTAPCGRPAILERFAQLLSPANEVRSRLRAARTSLEEAAVRLERPASSEYYTG